VILLLALHPGFLTAMGKTEEVGVMWQAVKLQRFPTHPRRSVLLTLSGLPHLQAVQQVGGGTRNCPFMAG
jgi:hypothetical protein